MQYHFRRTVAHGYTRLVGPGEGGLRYLEVGMLHLPEGGDYSTTAEESEVALVILSGQATIEAGSERWSRLGGRSDVFQGPGDSVYLPLGTTYAVTAQTNLEIGVCKALTDFRGKPQVVRAGEVEMDWRGRRNFERRVSRLTSMMRRFPMWRRSWRRCTCTR